MSGLLLIIIIIVVCCGLPGHHRYGYYGRRWHRPMWTFWDDRPPMGGFRGGMHHHGPMDIGGMGHGNPFGGPHGGGHMGGGFGGGMGHGGGAGRR